VVVLIAVVGLALISLAAVRAATTPTRQGGDAPALANIDPEQLGAAEQQAWAAYYQRDWVTLYQLLLSISQSQFGLSPAQALEATIYATRAQVSFAERGARDGEAESHMRRFYTLVREPAGGAYDPARAAELEVGWWVIHRQRNRQPDTGPLVDALAALSVEVYGLTEDAARPAAEHRAAAMEISDRWVQEGRDPDSPLLADVRAELVRSYQALAEAVRAQRAATPPTSS
jgi:hypothetical protein